jgi:hypothetical protein
MLPSCLTLRKVGYVVDVRGAELIIANIIKLIKLIRQIQGCKYGK